MRDRDAPCAQPDVVTYNIHRAWRYLTGARDTRLRDRLRTIGADIVFLQEVKARRPNACAMETGRPSLQYEFWRDGMVAISPTAERSLRTTATTATPSCHGTDTALGKPGHLGARFERSRAAALRVDIRAGIFATLRVAVHLALTRAGEADSSSACPRIERLVPAHSPLISAAFSTTGTGGTSDARTRASAQHARGFRAHERAAARSFPAMLPLFRLDRIYVRGFRVRRAHVHHGPVWGRISDHAVLTTTLEPL